MSSPSPKANRRFVFWAGGLLVAGVVVFLAVVRMSAFAESIHAIIAVTLGVVFTIALAVGLMALTFHSNRSGHDDDIEP